tara:strand:- start:741 stop:1622 length:882 start_codon:yes stop_codon:yes gene_type:complete
MALSFDEIWVYGGQLVVAQPFTTPKALGVGVEKVKYSSFIQGPLQVGTVNSFKKAKASTMIGRSDTMDLDRSLYVNGNVAINGDLGTDETLQIWSNANTAIKVNGGTKCLDYENGTVWIDKSGEAYFEKGTGGDTLSGRFDTADGKPKPFDIKHPSKEGWRLRYACIEGPEVGVYCRGRVRNEKIIKLPWYWKDLVNVESISVQLQPIGSHQDVIVKRWDSETIYLQGQGGLPINCFYHVYGERKDINPLITEYEGDSWKDYPDPNFNPEKVNYKDRVYNDEQYAGKPNTVTV